ncbi:Six-hairpin glycosidase-like protein [Corchorus capsularis]|uniref:Six-hairpin glycosidase-like protein n=1 Tax=Corchorus capsularis TaxID=210143 RepID=A0A1R3J717_COCAP|nr:Six-hairpin glycosidase-like protein [Corchorus capsularis]
MMWRLFFILVLSFSQWGAANCKVCTNFNTDIAEDKRKAAAAPHHEHPADIHSLDEFNWAKMKRKLERFKVPDHFLKQVPLHNVRLDPKGLHGRAQKMTLDYLLMLDVDRLVWSFRKTASLRTRGKPYGGWEKPEEELRGHYVGHYLSATALLWASTHDQRIQDKMSKVVNALHECQQKLGSGYLSAFPSEQFDRVEALKDCWAPYYTIHKIMAGLLDQYKYAGNQKALKMLTWMVEYFYKRVQNVISKHSIERHHLMLAEEHGGMNDLLYRLYNVTGDPKHFLLGRLFDKPCFLGALALQEDELSGYHSNTHIPIVIGAQMRYELTGDPLYEAIGTYFMDIVNSSHSYATGGTSVREAWSDPKRLATTLETQNEETCTTYNMLKVSGNLFRWSKEMAYADYYERALTNGILSIQKGPGVYIYFFPLGRGVSKAISHWGWGKPFDAFWCCYGTASETFSKLGDSIYFEEEGKIPTLYITQFISSSLVWESGNAEIHQIAHPVFSWDPIFRVEFSFPVKGTANEATLNIRLPFWSSSVGAKAEFNAQNLPLPPPGSFLSVTKKWNAGDKLTLELPINLRLEHIQDDRPDFASVQAILFGPYVLAGHSNGDWDIQTKKYSSTKSLSEWITPIPQTYNSLLVSFSQAIRNSTFALSKHGDDHHHHETMISMLNYPQPGTNGSVNATFRLIIDDPNFKGFSSVKDVIGKSVALEPFDLPGMAVAHQGPGKNLTVVRRNSETSKCSSTFRLVAGLDGKKNSVSLEADTSKGCFVVTSGAKTSVKLNRSKSATAPCVRLSCNFKLKKSKKKASFLLSKGISQYDPISFVAKGATRSFLLQPIHTIRDQHYTIYFNITA